MPLAGRKQGQEAGLTPCGAEAAVHGGQGGPAGHLVGVVYDQLGQLQSLGCHGAQVGALPLPSLEELLFPSQLGWR